MKTLDATRFLDRLGHVLIFLVIACAVGTQAVAVQQLPHNERGFQSAGKYDFQDIDQVNLHNGNLSVTLPIGQRYSAGGDHSYGLTLVYNSKLWDWSLENANCGIPTTPSREPIAEIASDSNAGLGWRLSLGELYRPMTGDRNPSSVHWLYVSPDGAERLLYRTLHEGEVHEPGVFYSRDGSYLRLRVAGTSVVATSAHPSGWAVVEFPDGKRHWFEPHGAGPLRIREMDDAFGNRAHVGYTMVNQTPVWSISDPWRTQTVTFKSFRVENRSDWFVKTVELTTFGNKTGTWTFDYTQENVERPPGHDPRDCVTGPWGPQAATPVLKAVWLPDGSSWQMKHQIDQPAGGAWLAGALTQITLPTLGKIRWEYGLWNFPTGAFDDGFPGGEPPEFLTVSAAVSARAVDNIFGHEYGRWTYRSELIEPDGYPHVPYREMRTTKIEEDRNGVPLHSWTHYFSARAGTPDYGLPFSPARSTGGGRFLSEVIDPARGSTRTISVRYERDPDLLSDPGSTSDRDGDWNWRVADRHIDFGDSSWKRDASSGFDGLGHYRTMVTTGSYGSARTETRDLNANAGSYPGSFTLPRPERWVLTTFSKHEKTESGQTATREVCMDAATGALLRERRLKTSGGSRSRDDIVRIFTRNSRGEVTQEDHYGADRQSVNLGSLCGLALPANPWHSVTHGYAFGSLAWSKINGASYRAPNLHIDRASGLAATSYDIAGVATVMEYDKLGRLLWEKPRASSSTQYVYSRATGNSSGGRAKVVINHRGIGTGASVLAKGELIFDGHGRVNEEVAYLPGGDRIARQLQYDLNGRLDSESSWVRGNPNSTFKSRFLDYDPWGRPGEIQHADFASDARHRTRFFYSGDRSATQTQSVATGEAVGGNVSETTFSKEEQFDLQGRLVKVDVEGSSASGVQATYRYDVNGELVQVTLYDGVQNQHRYFEVDLLGHLRSETHPENGTTVYSKYDVLGNAQKKLTAGSRDLTFAYDFAGRVTHVGSGNDACPTLASYTYATSNSGGDLRRGKLREAVRHSCGTIPWQPSQTFDVPIKETYTYAGRDGRLSVRSLDYRNGEQRFEQSWVYDLLGNVIETVYPQCVQGSCMTADMPTRRVEATYDEGLLTSVTDFADSIAYHPSGLVARITHASGAVDTIAADPWGRPLPAAIDVSLPTGFSGTLGRYTWDGAGNLARQRVEVGAVPVARLGERSTSEVDAGASAAAGVGVATTNQDAFYFYDAQHRLVRHTDGRGASRAYVYDGFSNVIEVQERATPTSTPIRRSLPASATTNRLTQMATYDADGNLTSWGSRTYRYDDADMIVHRNFPQTTYFYSVDDERLSTLELGPNDVRTERWTLRDVDGKVLRLVERTLDASNGDDSWRWAKDYIYRGDRLLAERNNLPSPMDTVHLSVDHLGTPRAYHDANGNGLADYHYWAYGERLDVAGADRALDATRLLQFTGHERDFHESWQDDLDYMHARYYSPHLTRFLSVDPVLGTPAVPKSWNRYTYARGNPTKYVDPDGRHPLLIVAGLVAGGVVFGPSAANGPESSATELIESRDGAPLDTLALEAAGGVGGTLAFKFLGRAAARVTSLSSRVSNAAAVSRAALVRSATAAGDDGVSAVTRAIQKHSAREGSAFSGVRGNLAARNATGRELVEEIVGDAGTTFTQRTTGRFGEVLDVVAPDGRGLRFGADGRFIHLLEPPG
ncbi:MAG: RHS repeat-associated core domain-containing protein [Acidobacteriota bacterium]